MPSPSRLFATVGAAAALAVLLLWAESGRRGGPESPPPAAAAAPAPALPGVSPAPAPSPGAAAGSPQALPPLPPSLRGTAVDGALVVDADGRFVPTPSALRLFDHFLSAAGEEPLEVIRARIVAEIEARLASPPADPAAARDAVDLLDRYLAFRTALRELASDPALAASADLERRLQWLRELRREHFGPELAEALFGEQEATTEVALEMRQVAADPTLSPDEKSERLAALEAQLPEDVRRARAEARAPLELIQAERALRASGASAGEIQALRESQVGPEAAARLAALDRQRAAWQARVDGWRAVRDRIRSDPTLEPSAREAALGRALAERFDAAEQRRIRALDAIEAARAGR